MQDKLPISRRTFTATSVAALSAPVANGQESPGAPPAFSTPMDRTLKLEIQPFTETLSFKRNDVPLRVRPFKMTAVRVTGGPYKTAQDSNLAVLRRTPIDRLLHNFRVNAGLPSSAQPLGGWEKPDVELRGHYTGHFLSGCGLMYASTGDENIRAKGDELVAELANCQQKLPGGYLSAFPVEFFDRLKARTRVWAPYYTIHKVMAGLHDMHAHCNNRQALDVLQQMADWIDKWTAAIPEPHMQNILQTEFGGMSDIFYRLARTTNNDRWATAGDRFVKKAFFNPLALRRDQLRGLHANTHIPQVTGAATRYELTGDVRFYDVADFFWYEVTSARSYATGGTSNDERWVSEPRRLAAELQISSETTECCCAYNMLKLTRQLYSWTGDPRYFDYYERVLLNHRIGTIDLETGATQYYLFIVPGAWKTFNSEYDSFWCCTGTGIEEYSKLNDSIYFHDDDGLYVNLFVPSEVTWSQKGVRVRQQTTFPEQPSTKLVIDADRPVEFSLRIRVPYWLISGGPVKVNGRAVEASAGPGSYINISRTWKSGDTLEMSLPLHLHAHAMPDDPGLQAVLYGPFVLAGQLGSEGLTRNKIFGPLGPDVKGNPIKVPTLRSSASLESQIKPAEERPLSCRAAGAQGITFEPLYRVFGQRYSIYWRVGETGKPA